MKIANSPTGMFLDGGGRKPENTRNPHRHEENMQRERIPSSGLNQGPWRFEETMLPLKMCHYTADIKNPLRKSIKKKINKQYHNV